MPDAPGCALGWNFRRKAVSRPRHRPHLAAPDSRPGQDHGRLDGDSVNNHTFGQSDSGGISRSGAASAVSAGGLGARATESPWLLAGTWLGLGLRQSLRVTVRVCVMVRPAAGRIVEWTGLDPSASFRVSLFGLEIVGYKGHGLVRKRVLHLR